MAASQTLRYIGIRHRVKKTADGEARPTQIAIVEPGSPVRALDLEDETAELDFVHGRLPVSYRVAAEGEDLKAFSPHHVRIKRRKDIEVTEVPSVYDGLRPGDVVAMTLGGSGDILAFALSRRAETVGATVRRLPPAVLKASRGDADKDDDAALLATLVRTEPDRFADVAPRDRALILVRESLRAREDAMKARIACEQRLRQRLVGRMFTAEDGLYPEGMLEQRFDDEKANDVVLQALLKEERRREAEVVKALADLPVYREVLEPIAGVGPMIAARLIASIGDVRLFATKAKLKAFCGAHVLADGRFPRRRSGELANWNQTARQALYLLGDQFNRRPDSPWGQKLREYKRKFREKHPEPIVVDGKKRYTDGHIHRMALWRTLTKFVERLYADWSRLERGTSQKQRAA